MFLETPFQKPLERAVFVTKFTKIILMKAVFGILMKAFIKTVFFSY